MKKIFSILFAAVLSAAMFSACTPKPADASPAAPSTAEADASETPAADAELPDKLILGLDASFPPMGFLDENNEVVGVDIDIAKAVCERLGMEFEAKPIEWAAKEMELDTGKITCIWNGMTITPEREEAFCIGKPYMSNKQVIVVRSDAGIAAKADLAGKLVAAQTDSSGEEALKKDAVHAEIKDGAHKQYADYVTALNDLELKRIDAIVMDSVVANYYISQNAKDMIVLEEDMGNESYGIAVKKGNDALMAAIEGAMSELAADGRLAEISNKWFGRDDMILTY